MVLFIYLVKRPTLAGYGTYDSFVVVASSERAARHTYPNQGIDDWKWDHARELWVDIRDGDGLLSPPSLASLPAALLK